MAPATHVLVVALLLAQAGASQEPLVQIASIELPGVQGRIDHLAVDRGGQRAFIAALGNDTVEVIDLSSSVHLRSLPGFHEPQGVALAPSARVVVVANGQGDGVQFLNADTYQPGRSVRLGEDSDNVRYDAKANRILVGYGNGALASIDPVTGSVLGQVRLTGHPESFQLEQNGPRAFVNVPSAGQLAVVDRVSLKVVATWPVTTAKENYPLALDEAGHRIFVGCRKPARVLVYDSVTGRETGAFDVVGDTDDLFFDARRERVYVSGGEGYVDVFDARLGSHFGRLAHVSTAPGARTSLFVPDLNRLLVAVPHRGSQKAEVRVFEAR